MPTFSRPRLSTLAMLVITLFSIIALTVLAAPLFAAESPAITVTPSEGRAGKNIDVEGQNFQPGAVQLRWNDAAGQPIGDDAVADSTGHFVAPAEFPRDAAPGNYSIFAVQDASTAITPVVVTPPSSSGGGTPAPVTEDEVFKRAMAENAAKAQDGEEEDNEADTPATATPTPTSARRASPAAPGPAPSAPATALPAAALAPPAPGSEVPQMVISSQPPSPASKGPLPSFSDPRLQGAFSPDQSEADVNTIALRMLAVIPLALVVVAMLGKLRFAIRSGTLWARS